MALTLACPCALSWAQGFSAFISPPRFELTLQPGVTQRQVIDIQHASVQPGRYRVYTNDWRLEPDGTVRFSDALAPGSCRPWVALERNEIALAGQARFRFRFELTAPTDAPRRECRFAIMVEGLEPTNVHQGPLRLPVGGRIAVMVYAGLEGSAPRLELIGHQVASLNGLRLPELRLHNSGDAHGRLDGTLSGSDADGQALELMPDNGPVLPGETRDIALRVVTSDDKSAAPIRYPLTLKGTLSAGRQQLEVALRFAP